MPTTLDEALHESLQLIHPVLLSLGIYDRLANGGDQVIELSSKVVMRIARIAVFSSPNASTYPTRSLSTTSSPSTASVELPLETGHAGGLLVSLRYDNRTTIWISKNSVSASSPRGDLLLGRKPSFPQTSHDSFDRLHF